jgi:predicted phosphodiesterase
MIRTLIVGDGHDKWSTILPLVDAVVKRYTVSRVILMGDLVNDWSVTAHDELNEIRLLTRWINTSKIQVETLIGNHDVYYLLDSGDHRPETEEVRSASPGHHYELRGEVKALLSDLNRPLKISTVITVDDREFLLTHAGLTKRWADFHLDHAQGIRRLNRALNHMYDEYDWADLYTIGPARGGISIPSPLWADREELLADPYPDLPQIVGHTPVSSVEEWIRPKGEYRTGWPLIFCDTMSSASDGTRIGDWTALLVDDEFSVVSLEDPGDLNPLEHQYETRYERLKADRKAHDHDEHPAWRHHRRN